MSGINLWAVIVAAFAAVVVGMLWYSLLFGKAYMEVRGINPDTMTNRRPPVGEILVELVRYLVIAFVLAHFVVALGVDGWMGALELGLWIGIGFQVTLLMGALLHEKMPLKLYLIHAGDALVKTLIMALILGIWR